MSQNRARSFIRTKRWCKCIIQSKKLFTPRSRFSTYLTPVTVTPVRIYERTKTEISKVEVPKVHLEESPAKIDPKLRQSPDESVDFTTKLDIADPTMNKRLPMFSVLDRYGCLLKGSIEPSIEKEKMIEMYNVMNRVQTLDDVFFNAQRQGRISFYMQSSGEEATQIGANDLDIPYPRYFITFEFLFEIITAARITLLTLHNLPLLSYRN